MITGIHHFAIIVSSEKSVAFYERLGFNVTFKKKRAYDMVVLMEGNGLKLEMFIDPDHPCRATDPENLGLRHLAFKVEDIEEASRKFGNSPICTDWVGERYCMISDPDGLPIELHE